MLQQGCSCSVPKSCPTLTTPWTAACQPSLSFIISQSLPKLMFIELGMLSNHLNLCQPLLILPSIFPSIRVFSNESAVIKASADDGIPAEVFQILKDDANKVLHSICQQIWKTREWPQDWKRSIFIPISKKGSIKECSNYWTIALISHASKAMLKT